MRLQHAFAFLMSLFLLGACSQQRQGPQVAASPATQPTKPLYLSGPYVHENLAVYLVHGPDKIKGKAYLTLAEAMEQKRVVVHETGSVNELAIENVGDDDVYIQSGEIVKGGRQDRTLGTDMIITKAMGKTPIASFCVEHGRWTRRGDEMPTMFLRSDQMVSGKEMKLASNSNYRGADQSKVWASVAENQQDLAKSVGQSVNATTSPSSYQLTLESPALKGKTDDYVTPLARALDDPKNADAIGWCYAVNGEVSGANVYANAQLFRKLWPKLLQSGAVEALAEKRGEAGTGPTTRPTEQVVMDFLSSDRGAKPTEKQVNARTNCATYDGNDSVMLETTDSASAATVHRNYMRK